MRKVLPFRPLKLGPSDFQKEVEKLQREGRMPTLDAVLDAVDSARLKFRKKILAARRRKKAK
jgi:hypothetical protein